MPMYWPPIKKKSQSSFLFQNNRLYFYSSFRLSAKLRGKHEEHPHTPCPHKITVSCTEPSPPEWGICYNPWTCTDIVITQSPYFVLGSTLDVHILLVLANIPIIVVSHRIVSVALTILVKFSLIYLVSYFYASLLFLCLKPSARPWESSKRYFF